MTDNNLGVGYGRYKVGEILDINDPQQAGRVLVRWHGENDGLSPEDCQWQSLRKGSDDPGHQQNGKFIGMRPGATVYGTSYETDNQYGEFHGTIHKHADPGGSPNSDLPQSVKSEQVGPNISSDSSSYSQAKKGDVYHDSQFSSYDHKGMNIFDYSRDHGPPGKDGSPSGKKSKHASKKDSIGYMTFGNPGDGDYSTGSKGGLKKEPGSLIQHLTDDQNNESAAVPNAAKTLTPNFYQNIVKKGANKSYKEPGFSSQQDKEQSDQEKQDTQNQDQPGGQDPSGRDDQQLNNFLGGGEGQEEVKDGQDGLGTETPDPGLPTDALTS